MRLISQIEAAWHLDDSEPPVLSATLCGDFAVALKRWPMFFVLEVKRHDVCELHAIDSAHAAWAAYHRQVGELQQGNADAGTSSARILDFSAFKSQRMRAPSRAV